MFRGANGLVVMEGNSCFEKSKINEKEAGVGPFFNCFMFYQLFNPHILGLFFIYYPSFQIVYRIKL